MVSCSLSSNDCYDATILSSIHSVNVHAAHQELFRGILQEVLENERPDDEQPIRDEAFLREIRPFDLRE